MKTTFLFLALLLLIISNSYAQDESIQYHQNAIGVTFSSFGNNDLGRIKALMGAAGYRGENFYSFGVSYLHSLRYLLDFETGLEYEHHRITTIPNVPPGWDYHETQHSISLISIPFLFRYTFVKYIFIQGGPFLDFDLSGNNDLDSQTGLGLNLGLGLNYDFKCGVSVFANPYLKFHSIIPFSAERYQNHLFESAFRFGIAYRL